MWTSGRWAASWARWSGDDGDDDDGDDDDDDDDDDDHHQGRRPLPWDRPHRPVEQDHRAAGNSEPGFHAPATGHRPQLCRKPAKVEQSPQKAGKTYLWRCQVCGLLLWEAFPRRSFPCRVFRTQSPPCKSGVVFFSLGRYFFLPVQACWLKTKASHDS